MRYQAETATRPQNLHKAFALLRTKIRNTFLNCCTCCRRFGQRLHCSCKMGFDTLLRTGTVTSKLLRTSASRGADVEVLRPAAGVGLPGRPRRAPGVRAAGLEGAAGGAAGAGGAARAAGALQVGRF